MSAGGSESDSDFEINLAPIIDCFTVLITYMLVSASFISLSSIDVSVATASDQPPPEQQQPQEPPAALTIELQKGAMIRLLVTGKTAETIPIKALANGEWDLGTLKTQLAALKTKYPNLAETSVKAEPTIKYRHVVQVIEATKRQLPKVVLGE